MARPGGVRSLLGGGSRRADRMLAVLRTLNERGEVALADLTAELRVSAATMRRDVADMADQGLLVRTRGGARPRAAHDEVPVQLRDGQDREAKHRVAVRAAELIPGGPCVVAVTGGTTTAAVARALAHRPRLTIVTNAVTIAVELAQRPTATVVLAGGVVRGASMEASGPLAEHAFAAVGVDVAVLGVDGITAAGGATTWEEVEARTNRAMVQHARRVMVVADGSKVGRVTAAPMVGCDRIDLLVTDSSADPAELARLRDAGVVVHLVEPRR